jgi:lipopolysaccharide export system protein LptA
MKILRLAAVMVAIALAAPSTSRADDADKDKPINFASDTGGYDNANGTGDLTGNATITQGTLVLHADRIVFRRNADNSFSATALGNPVTFRQKREGSDDYDEAYAQRISYNGQQQLVELFDHALLKQGPTQEMRSDYISYNRASGVANFGTAQGSATTARPPSRVTGVILPKDINAAGKGKDDKSGDAKSKGPAGDDKAKPAGADAARASDAAEAGAPPPLPLTIDREMKSK